MPGEKRRPPVPAWRKPAPAKPSSRGGWKSRPARKPADQARRLKILVGVSVLLAINLALFGTVYWLWPAKPACLVLIGAGYEENLSLPHNVYGWEGITALADFSQRRSTTLSKWDAAPLRLKHEPLPLTAGTEWARSFDSFAEQTLIVYLALHGGSDADGPYLLPHDASPHKDSRLRLRDLLDRLDQLSPRKNKVLLLDATGPAVDAEWGMLPNEFARGVVKLRERIEKVPNLVVICATDAEQRALAWEARRRTVFSHFVLEGLRGAADEAPGGDGNGRVDALELHRYVRRHVEQWAAQHRNTRQSPILLGGEDRARSIHLCTASRRTATPDEDSRNTEAPPGLAEAAKVFTRLHQHATAGSPVPQLLQPYQAYAVRLEQLLRAGAGNGLDAVRKELEWLDMELRRVQLPDLASRENTLVLPTLAGAPGPLSASAADEAARQLLNAGSNEMKPRWEAVARKAASATQQSRLRVQVGARALELAAEQPAQYLNRAAELVNVLGFAANERPMELHFVAMLHRDLPEPPPPPSLLAKALHVRRLAEQAALAALDGAQPRPAAPYCEQIFRWTRDTMVIADESRRRGEDCLFATDPAAWTRAGALFDRADNLYGNAVQTAEVARQILTVRDRAFTVLPALTRWTIARPQPVEVAVAHLEQLWLQAHLLSERAEGAAEVADLAGITGPANDLSGALVVLTKTFEQHCRRLAEKPALTTLHWQELEAALQVPEMDRDLRTRLIARAQAFLRLDGEEASGEDAAKVTREQTSDLLLALARGTGRLALARVGQRDFEAGNRDRARQFGQASRRLRAARNDDSGWGALRGAAEEIGDYYRRLPEHVQQLWSDAARRDAKESLGGLLEAERIARPLPSAVAPQAAEALRRARWSDLLAWQAERVRLDHWASDSDQPGAEPYFVAAGLRYLRDARAFAQGGTSTAPRLQARLDEVARQEAELRKPARLAVQGVQEKDRVVTSESRLQLVFKLRADAALPPGLPTVWLGPMRGLKARDPGRRVLEAGAKTAELDVPFELAVDAESASVDEPRVAASALKLRGVYRGQRFEYAAQLLMQRTPDEVARFEPLPRQARLTVRAAPEVFERYAPDKGAVAIVLDCSHSMLRSDLVEKRQAYRGKLFKNYDQLHAGYDAEVPCDYHEATEALGQMLATLPAGVNLSVFAFGQKLPGVQRARDAIRSYRAPGPWRQDELPALMQRLRALEPWNRSPTLRAMLTAKGQGFPPGFRGFKTLVVLTDDEDNEFQNDPELNPDGKATPEEFFRREFADQGVVVRFVGYKVKPGDEPRFRSQLERPYNQLPLGSGALAVDRPEDLAAGLQQALRRELRFQVTRQDGVPVPGMPDGGWPVRGGAAPDVWASVDPGDYWVRVQGDRVLSQRVSVSAGDTLRLLVGADGAGLAPVFVGDRAPGVDQPKWRLSLLERPAAPALAWKLALEQHPTAGAMPEVMRPRRPAMVWFESRALNRRLPLRWESDNTAPAPAWSLHMGGPQDAQPATLSAWWSMERPEARARLAGPPGGDLLAALKGASAPLAGGAADHVVVEGTAWEPWEMEAPSRVGQGQVCFVVRLRHPENRPVWVQLDGPDRVREQHRWYRAANRYTAIFAGLHPSQAAGTVRGLKVFSLEDWKRDSGTLHAELPIATRRPTPPGPAGPEAR